MISIVIVNYMNYLVTEECVNSIKNNINQDYEIIIVDNASPNKCVSHLKSIYFDESQIKIVENEMNFGFGIANNIGAKYAKGDVIFFVNSDVYFETFDFVKFAETVRANANVGMFSCKILYKDGSIQSVGNSFPTYLSLIKENVFLSNSKKAKNMRYRNYRNQGVKECAWCSGSFFAVRKENYLSIGGFDESIFLYGEDLELGLNFVKHGYTNYVDDSYYVYHLHGASTKSSSITFGQIMKRKMNDIYAYRKHQIFKHTWFLKAIFSFYAVVILAKSNLSKLTKNQ